MPDQNTTDSAKLQKLGERIQRRLDAQRPAKGVRAGRFRDYIREEWQREQQQAKQTAKPIQPPAKVQKRKPPSR